ncbi:hypothetical protein EDB87DRAFT_806209 [Lactarius vividus]|nr:hypothetical protein EDB87DRAFT_806209 [Lactarius vividus]
MRGRCRHPLLSLLAHPPPASHPVLVPAATSSTYPWHRLFAVPLCLLSLYLHALGVATASPTLASSACPICVAPVAPTLSSPPHMREVVTSIFLSLTTRLPVIGTIFYPIPMSVQRARPCLAATFLLAYSSSTSCLPSLGRILLACLTSSPLPLPPSTHSFALKLPTSPYPTPLLSPSRRLKILDIALPPAWRLPPLHPVLSLFTPLVVAFKGKPSHLSSPCRCVFVCILFAEPCQPRAHSLAA